MGPDPINKGTLTGEEVVISGISGYFPDTDNVQKLIDNLYNKVDMVKKYNSPDIKHPELPQHYGKIGDMNKFDSQFFRFTHWQAASFDPIGRKIIEQAYNAIFDAGINPETLRGTKIGVFIGAAQSDASTMAMYDPFSSNGFVMSGFGRTMIANRISYWIDGKGPSHVLESGSSSSIACLQLAVERINAGDCDSALVGASSQIVIPTLTVNMKKAGLLCLDGKTKCFDKNGDGYVRSDVINLMFLQKSKHAKRIYAQVYHVKGKHFLSDTLFSPSRKSEEIEKFIQEFYSEIDVSPHEVEYIEANATGIAKTDEDEIIAIGNVFTKVKPIKVGSIKSNIGHTEPASGICSLTKICLSYQRGEIPANLHYNEPQDHIPVIREGKVQVLTDNTKFNRSFTALNNFSYSGSNYHVLLKGHYKPKDFSKYKSEIPRLVLVSGRQEQSVTKVLKTLEENPIDPEQIALLNNIFKYNIRGHTGRGYTIIDTSIDHKTKSLARGFQVYDGTAHPVWFLYSGMGSQWPAMGAELMRIPIFAEAIERCNKALQTKGVDVIKIITDHDEEILKNILNCFVGIAAVQIALTDLLRSIGITPDKIIGHSTGEITCAYADGSLTLEEAMLFSYLRGVVSLETKLIKGKMAAIGLGHTEIRKICPPEIDIACQNSSESTTISGPDDDVEKLVAYLTKQSIFAKTVASSGIAYHSRYIADAGSSLLVKMKDIVKNPKPRGENWLSTSYAPDRWSEEMSKYASPEYFTHNLKSTVVFDETAKMIPNDAVVIEIAPHGLMQAIMKRSHKSCINLSLARRGEKDGVKRLLQTIGELYEAGLNPEIDNLYPTIEFPVSTETPPLSHLTHWDHSVEWFRKNYCHETKMNMMSYEFIISMYDDNYSFYQGSVRNGVNIFSEAAVLVVVWKTLAMFNGRKYTDTPVEFANVKFSHEVIIKPDEVLKLLVVIQKGTNIFEVTHHSKMVASGLVYIKRNTTEVFEHIQFVESDFHLNGKDIYEIMSTKGITYEDQSKSIKHINLDRNKGLIKWENNWVLFLDSLFLLNALSRNHNGVSNLKLITRLLIDVEAHKNGKKVTYDTNKDICYGAQVFHDNAITKCSGVLLTSIAFNDIPKVGHNISKQMQIKTFTPHILNHNISLQAAMQINLQIISENVKRNIVMYYKNSDLFANISEVLKEIVRNMPSLDIVTKSCTTFDLCDLEVKPDVLLLENIGAEKIQIDQKNINEVVDFDKFIITINEETAINIPKQFREVTNFKIGNQRMVLLRKSTATTKPGGYYYIPAPFKSEPFSVKLVKEITNGSKKYIWAEHSSVPNNEVIQVVYSGVYIKDVEKSVETKNNLNKHGIGFSGINARGERVMGVKTDGSVSSLVEANHDFLWPVPNYWKLEEAATVPLPYIQAFYCLRIREQLSKGSNVYITHGDTAFGQAVISLCLNLNYPVFTTVSNATKKKVLMNNFGELEETHIGYANDVNFLSSVINATKNQLCSIVINCDRGQARQEAMKFVGFIGTFLDVSDHDMEENDCYGMAFNTQSKSYKSVRLSNIFLPEYSSDSKKLKLMLAEGIINGSVRPIPRVIYTLDALPRALKLLTTDNIPGSVLINVYDTAVLKNDHNIMQRLELSPSKSYIVVCDGTVLGVELIEHLIERGAKQLLIHIKPKLMNGYFHVKYASWKKKNIVINFNSDDLYSQSACDALIAQGEQLGGLSGIFIAQNELPKDTGKIDQETSDIYSITSNLDVTSRNCSLNHFATLFLTLQEYNELAFSKIEKCCFTRKEIGLPSLILRHEANEKTILAEAISKLCSALDASLKQNYTSVFQADPKPNSRLYSEEKTSISDGLGALFRYIPEEECIATEPVISMRTLVSHENEYELHLNPDDDYVMMVPGLDGNFQTLRLAAERLKLPAITLQLEPDVNTTIPDIAKRILTIIKQRFHLKSKFYILGYSFGVNVALELAALLEEEGRTGVVFCLDSSPGAFKDQLITYIGDMTGQKLQNSVIEHFYNLFTGKTFDDIEEDVAQTLEWSEKINKLVEKVKGKVTYTHEFLKTLIDVVYKRIMMAKSYEPEFKLESDLVLLRGIRHPELTKLSDDYGLSKYSNKPVKVFDLEADHAKAPQDIRISNIINKMLDPVLLNDFENKNLCQYYYA